MSKLFTGIEIFLAFFVALPVAILLVVITLVVIAAHNFMCWAEGKWWK